ncbi:hypothetical protein, partial [Streptomyces tauricus]|uniref:hypothetical protein n=1 Tax=Streptomyces tauricus TaxID=68274 RepID=UPI001BC8D373
GCEGSGGRARRDRRPPGTTDPHGGRRLGKPNPATAPASSGVAGATHSGRATHSDRAEDARRAEGT